LSLLYSSGKGVKKNDKESMFWLQQAAVHGSPQAQSNLGVAFNLGRNLPQDIVKAYAWCSIAAASGDSVAVTNRDVAARKMTTKQLEHAKMLIQECQKGNFKNCL
jgi:TPR repeat protein